MFVSLRQNGLKESNRNWKIVYSVEDIGIFVHNCSQLFGVIGRVGGREIIVRLTQWLYESVDHL